MLRIFRGPLRLGLGTGALLLAWTLTGAVRTDAVERAQDPETKVAGVQLPPFEQDDPHERERRERARRMRDILPIRARIREESRARIRITDRWHRPVPIPGDYPEPRFLTRILTSTTPGVIHLDSAALAERPKSGPSLELYPSAPLELQTTSPLRLTPPTLDNSALTISLSAVDLFYQPAASGTATSGYAGLRLPLGDSARIGMAFSLLRGLDPDRASRSNGDGLLFFLTFDF